METQQETAPTREGLLPVRSKWFKFAFFLFLLTWMSYMLYEALAWEGFEDYLFVYLLAPIVYVLLIYRSAILLAPDRVRETIKQIGPLERFLVERDTTESEMTAETTSHGRESKAEEEKFAVYMILWTIALPVGIFLFGMAWSLPVYIFGFVWFFTGNVNRAALVTGVSIVFIYFLFIEILNVLLYTGILGLPDPLNYLP